MLLWIEERERLCEVRLLKSAGHPYVEVEQDLIEVVGLVGKCWRQCLHRAGSGLREMLGFVVFVSRCQQA